VCLGVLVSWQIRCTSDGEEVRSTLTSVGHENIDWKIFFKPMKFDRRAIYG
jgi:hypothetical protein